MTSGFTDDEAFYIEYGLEDWNTQPNSSGVHFDVRKTNNPPTVGPDTPNVLVATYIDEVVTWNGGSALNLQHSGSSVYGTLRFWKNMRQGNADFIAKNWRTTARHEGGHGIGLENGNVNDQCSIGTTIMYPSWTEETFITDCDNQTIDSQTTIYPPTPTPTPTPCATIGQGCFWNSDCCSNACGNLTYTCLECEQNPQEPLGSGCMSERCKACYDGGGVHCTGEGNNCWTPIIVDVAGDGFKLTTATNGVNFDDGRGTVLRTAWTEHNSDDAWLVLDRNENGMIDDGTELFGNAAPQPATNELYNGFRALKEYDTAVNGGNEDGRITDQDTIFASLRLWQDANHDGISAASELHSLPSMKLASIDLAYKLSKYVDSNGNTFKFRAKIKDAEGAQLGRWVYDVFLDARRAE